MKRFFSAIALFILAVITVPFLLDYVGKRWLYRVYVCNNEGVDCVTLVYDHSTRDSYIIPYKVYRPIIFKPPANYAIKIYARGGVGYRRDGGADYDVYGSLIWSKGENKKYFVFNDAEAGYKVDIAPNFVNDIKHVKPTHDNRLIDENGHLVNLSSDACQQDVDFGQIWYFPFVVPLYEKYTCKVRS